MTLKRIALLIVFLSLAIYTGDYISVRYRIPGDREQFGKVQVRRYYAVPHKDGKTEFLFDQPESDTCIHSLFPHLGYAPCWYLARKPEKRIDM